MKTMQTLVREFLQMTDQAKRMIIHRHINPDPDAIGTQLGLKSLLQTKYPDKTVLAAGTISKGLTWLGEMDQVSAEDYQDALVIVVDTPIFERIDGKEAIKDQPMIKIDHHLHVESFATIEIEDTSVSSASELVTAMVLASNDQLCLTPTAASFLYAGIAGDTGRFLHSNTSQLTFERTAYLMAEGANLFQINQAMNQLSLAELKFQSYAIERIRLLSAGLASLTITQADLELTGMSREATNSLTNLPGRLEEVLSWVLFIEKEDQPGHYRARLRSNGPNVNQVAIAFNGGGHEMASGATVESEAEKQALIDHMIRVNQAYKVSATL